MRIAQDFEAQQGSYLEIEYTLVDANGAPINLTGLTGNQLQWVLGVSAAAVPLLDKIIGSGITLSDPAAGKFKVTLQPADTVNLYGQYYVEAVHNVGGQPAVIAIGSAVIRQSEAL